MKLSKLFENDEIVQQIWNLAYKHPMIICDRTPDLFIEDLPKNITDDQLNHLCKLSFDDKVYQYLFGDRSISRIAVSHSRERTKQEIWYYLRNLDPKYIEVKDMLYTWKRYCDLINDALKDDDSDFED